MATTLRYFENFEIGETVRVGEYLVTAEEIVAFARRWDPQPFHVDTAAARASVHGDLIACGAHTLAIRSHLLAQQETQTAVVAGVGWDEVRFPNPVRAGDRLTLEVTHLSKRESRSRADRGIATSRIRIVNQNGDVVLSQIEIILIAKRPSRSGVSVSIRRRQTCD